MPRSSAARVLEIVASGVPLLSLSERTLKRLVLLAELIRSIARLIELDLGRGTYNYVYPSNWAARMTVEDFSPDRLVVEHRAELHPALGGLIPL